MIRTDTIVVPEHVHGYPGVAFGGYVAGVLAAQSGASAVRVDFRRRVPVETPVTLRRNDSDGLVLTDLEGLPLVEAVPATLALTAPPAPSWDEALAVTESSAPLRHESDCYGCGSLCAPGRGLRLFPWPQRAQNRVVAAWTPDESLAADTGDLPTELVWAALDCPGGWVAMALHTLRHGTVTAALTATQLAPVRAGRDYVSYAWPIAEAGRKSTVGVALATRDGAVCALAEALWIHPKPAPGHNDRRRLNDPAAT
ncbi:PaaI family thioesterase [Nocardia brasiliensis]|uniref:PaaI family thioesterase n=1 Tax=Nocardia brasiliensis TaxID=37326 RepID=UPI0005699378|nr:hypothetical protein [Nocardia brasiliensis]